MDDRSSDQLDKILALIDSSHDAEAVVAVRKAREMLLRSGLQFSDLARGINHQAPLKKVLSIFSGGPVQTDVNIAQLRKRIEILEADVTANKLQVEFWRRRSADIEQNLALSQSQAERWRQLARDTVEKLWSVGQDIQKDDGDLPLERELKTASKAERARKTA